MNSIVERLRGLHTKIGSKAADLIEQQAATIKELEAERDAERDNCVAVIATYQEQLAALRQRIADAPVVAEVSSWWNGGTGFGLCNFKGKRPEPGAKLISKEDLL